MGGPMKFTRFIGWVVAGLCGVMVLSGCPLSHVPEAWLTWDPQNIVHTHVHDPNGWCYQEVIGTITIKNNGGSMFGGWLQLGDLRDDGIGLSQSEIKVGANKSITVKVTFRCVKSGRFTGWIKLQWWDWQDRSINEDFVWIDVTVP